MEVRSILLSIRLSMRQCRVELSDFGTGLGGQNAWMGGESAWEVCPDQQATEAEAQE